MLDSARLASAISVIVGVVVLIGWQHDVEILKRIIPGLTAMNPVAAIGFICLGCALASTGEMHGFAVRLLGGALAATALAIGLLRLGDLLGILEFQIDQSLFPEKLITADFGRTNQIAPNTAINFVLLGTALAAIDHRRLRRYGQLMTVVAAMSSLLALMGYAYGLPSFYGIGTQVAMPLPTAATFLVLSIGVLCARPTHGIMAVVSSNSSGGTMIRRLLPAALIIPVALGGLRLAAERAMLFDAAFGAWLLAVAIMTAFAALVGWNALLLFRGDVARARAEAKLAYQATHDALTQLPNRRFLIDRLDRELERSRVTGTLTAVLFIDLDLFKVINDSLGHVIGDQLLIAAGRRIQDCLESNEVVTRLSGDEFTVLISGMHSREPAIELAARIRHEFNQPFTIGLHEVFTSVSIGIAFSSGNDSPRDLIRHADIAMYQAKARGKGRYEIFEPAMDRAAQQRQRLETDLRRAIAGGELRVYYQPEVEMESGRLVGMEALVRWQHPERGLIAPAEFIAVAEETGLIIPIGRWVLREACRQAKEWQTKYPRNLNLMISVNVSGRHLQQPSLIDDVREVLTATGLDPGHLVLEITETVAMAGAETTVEILTRLKALGVQLAIDDFGTGFSSLAYLKRFPVDLLKIDKSFVHGVALHGHDTAIVEAIIALGHALGLRVIAEGVETPAQLMELRALGSELGQGFLFGGPLSNDLDKGMPPLLQEERSWTTGRELE